MKKNSENVIKNTPCDMLLNWEQKCQATQRSIRKTRLRFRQDIGSQLFLQTLDVIVKSLQQTFHKRCDTGPAPGGGGGRPPNRHAWPLPNQQAYCFEDSGFCA